MSNYAPSGALFVNSKKKSNNSPDYTGKLELSDEVINDLVSQMERGVEKPQLSLVGWKKVSKQGREFLSIIGNVFEERGNGAEPQQQKSNSLDDNVPF
jgi:hypothetical protein